MTTSHTTGLPQQPESSPLVPASPESSGDAPANKRKRLAKAFPRPLDRELAQSGRVRVKFSVRDDEYMQLVELQQRLAAQGVVVKKGALLRAGLRLLAAQDDDACRSSLAELAAID